MERMLSDVRMSLRVFRRSPGLALTAVTAFAMGIGFTTTMFSIVRGGTRSLPFDEPEQIVVLTRTATQYGYDVSPTWFDYVAWSRELRSWTALEAFEETSVNLGGDTERPERRSAATVTPGTFAVLGVRPMLGRALLADDARPDAPKVVLLGYDLWRARFNGDSGTVNRIVRLDGEPHTVIGVMPRGFAFPVRSALWTALATPTAPVPTSDAGGLRVFGRLKDNVDVDQARAELSAIAAGIARDHPATHENLSARALPFVEMEMDANTPTILYLMLGVVSFVLLIACANVANLLLARAALRSRETALRTALGASRRRIIAHHVAESLALAAAGGLAGLAIASVAVRYFAAMTAGIIDAFWIDFRVDGTVVLFATGVVAVAAVAAGLLPGLRATTANVAEVLKDATGGATGIRIGRLARGLVLAEVALATGFLIMTMTFTKTAVALRTIDLPFDARQVFTGQLGLTQAALGSDETRGRIARDVTSRLDATPGVVASALVSVLPGRGAGGWAFTVDAPAAPGATTTQATGLALVTPGFFDVLGARVLRGRPLDWTDGPSSAGVVVVNESWARLHSADRDPIGRRIWLGERSLEIVGVAPDLQMQDPGDRNADGVYASMLQFRPYVVRVMARSDGDPAVLTPFVRDAVESVDPDVPLFETASLYDAIYSDKKVLDAFGALFFVFGIGALFLTLIGVYGVVSFAVTRRAREIGVRAALGATRTNIVALVVRQGATLIVIGLGVGLLIAFAVSRALASVIDVVEPAGVLTYVAITGALAATAAVALLRPVRRALALDPMEALRRE